MKTHKGKSQSGFTLVEVLIALFLSTIILLGLAVGELKSLQYATNSFHYTLSLIQANNAVEKTWARLYELQKGDVAYNLDFIESLQPQFDDYTLTLTPGAGSLFKNELLIDVSWDDDRMTDELENRIRIEAMYPQIYINEE